jgi:hypothetical protein
MSDEGWTTCRYTPLIRLFSWVPRGVWIARDDSDAPNLNQLFSTIDAAYPPLNICDVTQVPRDTIRAARYGVAVNYIRGLLCLGKLTGLVVCTH